MRVIEGILGAYAPPFCCLGVPESSTSVRTASVRLKTYLRAVVLTGLWLLLDSSGQALACSCAGPADSLCRLMPINLAFVGTPTAVADVLRDGWPARKFTFRIQESFSSVEGPFVDVFSDKSTCGVDFVVGKSYLVDALKDGRGTITVSLCSLTRSAARGVEEIAILRRIAARQPLLGILGRLVEFLPRPRFLDPEVLQPLPDVALEILGGPTTRRMSTDSDGRFAVWDLPRGVYRVRVDLRSPFRLWKYTPGFQLHADPDHIELVDCPARLELIASRR